MNHKLQELMTTDYPVRIQRDASDDVYVAEFVDLPGCHAYGSTVEEAYRKAQEAKVEWLRLSLDQGLPLPRPSKVEDYSGRILVRLPTPLHAMLAEKAKLHGTSLNQYVVHLLSAAVVGDALETRMEELNKKVLGLEMLQSEMNATLRRLGTQLAWQQFISWGPTTRVSHAALGVFGISSGELDFWQPSQGFKTTNLGMVTDEIAPKTVFHELISSQGEQTR